LIDYIAKIWLKYGGDFEGFRACSTVIEQRIMLRGASRKNIMGLKELTMPKLTTEEMLMKDIRIKEGNRSKGGLNEIPTTPRPEPPKPQGIKRELTIESENIAGIRKILQEILLEAQYIQIPTTRYNIIGQVKRIDRLLPKEQAK